ncbi:MAG: hypothetical protein AAFY03_00950 [Pseudomonadota bacterium]
MIRPELRDALLRWRDPLAAAALGLVGLWLSQRGGLFFLLLGGFVVCVAAASLYVALRRMQFASSGEAPGVVEVLEGRIAYYAPHGGGYADLDAVVEVSLQHGRGTSWRFVDGDGDALLVPMDASGADSLPDALAALPGFSLEAVLRAMASKAGPKVVWRRTPTLTASG